MRLIQVFWNCWQQIPLPTTIAQTIHKVNINRQMKAENPGEIKRYQCSIWWAKLTSHLATVNTEGPEEEPWPSYEELAELIPLYAASVLLCMYFLDTATC